MINRASAAERAKALVWCAARLDLYIQWTTNVAVGSYNAPPGTEHNWQNPAVGAMRAFCEKMQLWRLGVSLTIPGLVQNLGQATERFARHSGSFSLRALQLGKGSDAFC